jgi:hypothetical protein
VVGWGGYETRFSGLNFINSPQRALFRHPNEAFLYDLDGSLTGTNIKEDYTKGGNTRGSSMVGTSILLPNSCNATEFSLKGTGGSICKGQIFRPALFKIILPSAWLGRALCVRTPWQNSTNECQSLQSNCNCLPFLLMGVNANQFMVAEGMRYNLQVA